MVWAAALAAVRAAPPRRAPPRLPDHRRAPRRTAVEYNVLINTKQLWQDIEARAIQ